MRSLFAVLTLLATGHAALAGRAVEPVDPHELAELPQHVRAIAPHPDGGALVLGRTAVLDDRIIAQLPPVLVRIGPDHKAAREAVPDVGDLVDVASRDGTVWLLGAAGAAVLRPGRTWQLIPLERRALDPIRISRIAAIDGHRAIVVRIALMDHRSGTIVDVLDGMQVVEHREFPGFVLTSPAADVAGSMWAAIRRAPGSVASDQLVGRIQYTAGTWTLWRYHGDDVQLDGAEIRDGGRYHDIAALAPDAGGGVYVLEAGSVVHYERDGTVAPLGQLGAGIDVSAMGWDSVRDRFVVVAIPGLYAARATSVRVVMFDRAGRRMSDDTLELPEWFTRAHNPPLLIDPTLAFGPDAVWLSAGPFVWRRTDHWTGYVARAAEQYVAQSDHQAMVGATQKVVALAVPSALAVGLGTFGAAAVHDEPFDRVARSYVAGVAGAVAPTMLLELCLPAEWATNPEPGPALVGQLFQQLGLVVGAGAAATASGFATWGVGEQIAASKSPDRALAGALIGGGLGVIGSVVVTNALDKRFSSAFAHRVAIASSLIASGASLGYQLGGGGHVMISSHFGRHAPVAP